MQLQDVPQLWYIRKKGEALFMAGDYAHHPTEFAAVLTALKEAIPGCYIRAIF